MSTRYFVIATVRETSCDQGSSITQLVLDRKYEGFRVYGIAQLKELADRGELWVRDRLGNLTRVRIFWSPRYYRWVATTNADETICNNLLSLPILRPDSVSGSVTTYATCAI